jgi:hypothetical protein
MAAATTRAQSITVIPDSPQSGLIRNLDVGRGNPEIPGSR